VAMTRWWKGSKRPGARCQGARCDARARLDEPARAVRIVDRGEGAAR
jgi:hypothetical protein